MSPARLAIRLDLRKRTVDALLSLLWNMPRKTNTPTSAAKSPNETLIHPKMFMMCSPDAVRTDFKQAGGQSRATCMSLRLFRVQLFHALGSSAITPPVWRHRQAG